jgi:hypothetical protein
LPKGVEPVKGSRYLAEPTDKDLELNNYLNWDAEAAAALAIFAFLRFYLRPRKRAHGQLLGMLMVLYGVARFAIEFLRATIRAHPGEIDLLTIGPLTNIGLLFAVDPEIPSLLKGLSSSLENGAENRSVKSPWRD